MKALKHCLIAVLLAISSCSSPPTKARPEYVGVDPATKTLVNEYMWLSKQNHIRFYNKVTIGFRNIDDPTVIGYRTYGLYFREIDLDANYWNRSTKTTRMALLFHELSHCYCGRDHDYAKNHKYAEDSSKRIKEWLEWAASGGGSRLGYFDDLCPTSLMFPVVLDDGCMKAHYQHYVTEMFERCKPW